MSATSATQPKTCRLATLGCKVNQYETQFFKEVLEHNGYREAQPGEPADLCLVNTCTVTHEADAKGRQLIRRLHEENPQARIVVIGCYAARDPQAVARLPGVAQVVPDKEKVLAALGEYGVSPAPAGIARFDGHQRAFVKVQDGCLLNCSYCIIPQVRPLFRSRPVQAIVDEVARLAADGYREIVLTGIHLGHYGLDLSRGRPKEEWCRLWHLLKRLETLPGDFRVRLSSLEAAEVRGDFVDFLAGAHRLCPHLHLCLQSGSDRILARMKRRYRVAGFLQRCRRLREVLDLPAFTSDVIVGFPGESEADFEATCQVVREAGFAKLHIFTFSPRAGTPAADLPDRVPAAVVRQRRRRLEEIDRELSAAYHRQLLGRRLEVLVEGPDPERPGHVRGTSCRYVPVSFPGFAPALRRQLVCVRVTGVEAGVLLARPEPTEPPAPPGRIPLY
jgi:threonylcarbamoyladenosine tRNA methylthiotransferase MtaB